MSDIEIEQSQVEKFAAVYAEALLTFLDSGEEQWLTWDGFSHRFDFVSVEREAENPAQLIVLTLNEHWARQIGDVDEVVDPEHAHFDPEALRHAVEYQLTEEGMGERILKGYLAQLARLTAQLEEAADDAPDEPLET